MALLKVEGLGVTIAGAPLLSGVGFTLAKGQRLGIMGEAGAGKSLLARALAGLAPLGATTSGAISIDDAVVAETSEARAALRGKRIGYIPPNAYDALDPLQKISSQISEPLRVAGDTTNLPKQVAELLAEIGLDDAVAANYPRDLSVSERQRVAVTIALATKPELLIADEPTAGLDLPARRKVIDLLERHCSERGMTLILASQDLKAIAMLCGRVLVMQGGRVVEAGEKQEVFGHPKHEHTRAMVATGRHRARTLMRAPIGGTLLEVRGLTRQFKPAFAMPGTPPVLAVDNLNFAIRAGESLALIGPAGSGKSTLIRLIAGLDRATGGELEFDHEVYHGDDLPFRIRRDITLVTRDPLQAFNPRLTVGESIAEPLRLEALRPMDELSARIVEVIRAVGLTPDALAMYPREFTAGQRQRLALARALITRPRLVLFDDPVSQLDVAARGEMLVLLNRLRADFGTTFVIATQDLEVVWVVADRVLVMDRGRIVEAGTPAQLLEKPQQPLTQQLIAAQLPNVGIVPVF